MQTGVKQKMYPAVLIVDDETTIIDSLEGILSDDDLK